MTTPISPYDMMALQQQQVAGGAVPGVVPMPGPSHYPPSFSYGYAPGMSTTSRGFGMLGSGVTAGIGSMPTVMSGVGMAAGIGSMFSASPVLAGLSVLEPTTLGFMAGSSAMAGGMGLGAAVGIGAPLVGLGLGAAAATQYAGRSFVRGGMEQQTLNAQLAGLQFANRGSPSFRGFGFQQLNQIGSMMREFESADPFTTMKDLNQLMDQYTGMGMHQGVRDAREFGEKFKQFAETVRSIATEMGTSLDEASKIFGEMRTTGFYTAQDVMGNVRSMQMARGLGMDEGTFAQMQAGASQVTRQAAMSGLSGARASERLASDLLLGATSRAGGGVGLFTGESLMDITGSATAAEAAAQLGGQFTGLFTSYLQAGAGRGLLAGLGAQEGDRFTGEMDADMMSRHLSGDVSMSDLSNLARPRLRTGAGALSFKARHSELASSLLEHERGTEVVLASIEEEAKKWAERGNYDPEEAVRVFLMEVLKADEAAATALQEVMAHRDEIYATRLQNLRAEQTASAMQLEMARNRTFGGLKQRIGGSIEGAFAPVRQAGADLGTYFDELGRVVEDEIFGVTRFDTSPTRRRDFAMRVASGDLATGIQSARLPSYREIERGTGLHTIARSYGTDEAIASRRRFIAGTQTVADFYVDESHQERLQMAMFDDDRLREEGERIVARYNAARFVGDKRGMERARDDLKQFSRNLNFGSMTALEIGTSGDDERITAFVAHTLKGSDLAKEIMMDGSIEDLAYETAEEMQEETISAAKIAGLSGTQARVLAEGGAGSRVLAWMGREGKGVDYVESFFASEAGRVAAGQEGSDALVTAFNKYAGGTDFTRAELEAAMGMIGEVRGVTFELPYDWDAPMDAVSREEMFDMLVRRAAANEDTQMTLDQKEAIRTNIERLGPEARRRIGALGRLQGSDLRGESYRTNLRSVAADLMAGKDSGARELDLIGGRMRKAAGSYEALMEYTGMDAGELIRFAYQKGIGSEDRLTADDRAELAQLFGAAEIQRSLSDTSGGGITMRGRSTEEQMLMHMNSLAINVQKATESTDKLVSAVEMIPGVSLSPERPDE